MLLNINGVSAPMVQNVLQRYPTPRALAEALESHGRACAARGLPPIEAKWLLDDVLLPGRRRRKLSETVCDFFLLHDLRAAPPGS